LLNAALSRLFSDDTTRDGKKLGDAEVLHTNEDVKLAGVSQKVCMHI
jgi:hypothetical protein